MTATAFINDAEAIERIHQSSLRVLSELGMRFHSERALETLRRGGVRVAGGRAYFTDEQVMAAVDMAAKEFTVHARGPGWNVRVNTRELYVTPGYGSASIALPDGSVRTATWDDFLTLAAIVQQGDVFSINGGILAQPSDVPSHIAAEAMVYATLKRSDKALFSVCDGGRQAAHIMELLELVFGDIRDRPCCFNLISTLSPLAIGQNALDTMEVCAAHGQPLVLAPGPMAGGTGPVTPAGNTALCNAEILGANVYAQLLRPGTPVVYGFAATVSDMRDMSVSNACPGFLKEARYGALLAKRYGFACRSGGGMSDAGGLTAQAGAEAAMGLFEAFSEGANLVMHATGSLHSFGAVSFEKFIFDMELIDRLRYYFSPLDVDAEALAFDAIQTAVEEGEPFMIGEHTLAHCRSVPWQWQVSLHGKCRGEPNAALYASIRARQEALLRDYVRPALSERTERAMDDYMRALGLDEELLRRV